MKLLDGTTFPYEVREDLGDGQDYCIAVGGYEFKLLKQARDGK